MGVREMLGAKVGGGKGHDYVCNSDQQQWLVLSYTFSYLLATVLAITASAPLACKLQIQL